MTEMLQSLKALSLQDYLACLYLPADIREDVATLYAFAAEIDRIPHLVSEPMPGEIRLQWWRDLVKSGDNVGSGPLAAALMNVIDKHNLPREIFHTYLEAKIFDLYQDPMPDMAALEGYIGETQSTLLQLSALIGGSERSTELADACGHGGMAIALSNILNQQAYHRHTQRAFIPLDILQKHGFSRETWLAKDVDDAHLAALAEIRRLAHSHLLKARSAIQTLPKPLHGHFLPLGLAKTRLKKVEKSDSSIFERPVAISPLSSQITLLKSSILGI